MNGLQLMVTSQNQESTVNLNMMLMIVSGQT